MHCVVDMCQRWDPVSEPEETGSREWTVKVSHQVCQTGGMAKMDLSFSSGIQ